MRGGEREREKNCVRERELGGRKRETLSVCVCVEKVEEEECVWREGGREGRRRSVGRERECVCVLEKEEEEDYREV